MNRLLLIIVVLFSIGADAKPAAKEWKNGFWGGGGAFLQTTYDRKVPDRIYALSDVSGLHLSEDGGDKWDLSNRGVKTSSYAYIHQAEKDTNIMYVIGRKLIRSDNRGRDWVAVQDYSGFDTRSYKNIAVDRSDAMKLFVADDTGRIYQCSAGGVTCAEYDRPVTGGNIHFLYITQDNRYLIAGFTSTGMKRYDLTDNSSINISLTGTNALRNWDYSTFTKDGIESFCVTAGHDIRCSSDGGNGWQIHSADFTTDSAFFLSAVGARAIANGQVRIVAYGRRVATPYGDNLLKVSDDSGVTWSADKFYNMTIDTINDPSKEWGAFGSVGNIYHIEFSPFNEDEVITSTDWLIAISRNGGNDWEQKIIGASNQVVTDCEVAPDDIGTTFCSGMDIGLYRSEDGLETWDAILPNTGVYTPQGFAVAGHHWKIELIGSPEDWNDRDGTVVIATSQWSDFVPRVWSCSDNGDTCVQGTGLPTTQLNGSSGKHRAGWGIGYPRSMTKAANDKLYLCIDGYSATENGGIFTSTDKGLTWTRTTQPDQWKCYNGIAADPTDPTGNTVMFSEFWYNAPDSPHGYYSTDGGVTWTDTGAENYVGWEIKYSSAGIAYKVGKKTGPQVYYSLNGTTWLDLKQLNDSENTADGIVIDPDNSDRLFVGVNDATKVAVGPGFGINNAVYMTDDASSGASATWFNLTGTFDCPSGIHDLSINKKYGKAGLLIAATDGCGVKTLELSPTMETKLMKVVL